MEILIVFILILLNGIFSMTEMALVSAKSFKLEKMKEEGVKGAGTAIDLKDNPNKYLSTIQIGITLIGILLGVFSGDKIAMQVTDFLNEHNILPEYSESIGTIVVVILVTFFSILLGELFPKRVGMTYPESIAVTFSRPMNFLSKLTKPFVALLTKSNNLLSKIFKIKEDMGEMVTEEEIKSIIRESTEIGEIQRIEEEIVSRVFELGDLKVKTLATHSADIVYFNVNDDWKTVNQKIRSEKHSSYPVCEDNNIDKVVGIVLIKDLFDVEDTQKFKVENYMREALFIDENTYAFDVLEMFQSNKMHYAIIIDEYGATEGMVTMDDLLDALVGDSSEFYHDSEEIVKRNDDSWIVDGKFPINEFSNQFKLGLKPSDVEYTTLAGMLINQKGSIPRVGEKIEISPYIYEVMDKDGQRIDKVLVTKLPPKSKEE